MDARRGRGNLVLRRATDPAARFRRFVERTAPGLIRCAVALLGDHAAAEDAAQLALLRTFRHWDRAGENPGAYTWKVLVNICRDERRRQARALSGWRRSVPAREPSPPAPDVGVADRYDVGKALRALPYELREVVALRYLLDLSVTEVARVLSVPEGTVKSMTARAVARLRVAMIDQEVEVHDDADR